MTSLQIEKLAFGGAGFGRLGGKACFVPFTAPGDRVEVRIEREKRSYLEGVAEEILSPADCRIAPVCQVFGVCGGCDWQHIDYEVQCGQKENIFAETMWRIARIGNELILPLVREVNPFAYRQRIQLKIHSSSGRLHVGFYRSGSHYVVDIKNGCPIARPEIDQSIGEIRRVVSAAPEPERIPQVDLSSGEDGSVSAIFHYIGSKPGVMQAYLSSLQGGLEHVSAIFLQCGRKDSIKTVFGPEMMEYTLTCMDGRELTMCYTADSFSQVNFRQNRRILDAVLSWSAEKSVNSVLDLYCGNGNFSIPVSAQAKTVVGMESYRKSIELARHNATINSVTNAEFVCIDSSAGVDDLAEKKSRFDLILLDPPRSGAAEVVSKVVKLQPSFLAYISCDPPTLARDLAILQKSGFRVESVLPVDMFPQTYHLESVAFLQAI